MKRALLLLALCAAGAAFAQRITGITLRVGTRFEFTDCAAGGSAAQTLTVGTYLFRVSTEDVWICYAATCAAGGEKFPAGMAMMLSIPTAGQAVSCRSTAATGDAIFTRADAP